MKKKTITINIDEYNNWKNNYAKWFKKQFGFDKELPDVIMMHFYEQIREYQEEDSKLRTKIMETVINKDAPCVSKLQGIKNILNAAQL